MESKDTDVKETIKTLAVERRLGFLTEEIIVKIGKDVLKDVSMVDSKGIGAQWDIVPKWGKRERRIKSGTKVLS